MPIGLGVALGIGGGKPATSSGAPSAGAGPYENVYSLVLDGANDHIQAGSISSFTLNAFSVWVKPSGTQTTSSGIKYVMSFGDNYEGLILGGDLSGAITNEVITIAGADGNAYWAYAGSGVTVNTDWHHIAGTWESSSSSTNSGNPGYDIYLDGNKVGNHYGEWYSSANHAIACDNMSVGARRIGGALGYYFGGHVDEVGLFSTALSASNISDIYNSGVPQSIEDYNPVTWWRMGDGDTYPTITDHGSGGNDGTMTNMASDDIVEEVPS